MAKSMFFIVTLILSIALVGCNELNQQNTPTLNQETNGSWENLVIESDKKTEPFLPIVVREICPYECCVGDEYKNELCDADEYCNEDNNCKKYGCVEDSGCNAHEICSDYSCLGLSCSSCEYADNHQCLAYQCCENVDCSEGECVNHVCEVLYKFDWDNAPKSVEQSATGKSLPNLFRKNGYEYAASGYCRIDNSTYHVDNINQCSAELLNIGVNEGQVYHVASVRISNTSGNYDLETINSFLILYSKLYGDYYTVKIKDASKTEIITSTVTREEIEDFIYGDITREEFLSTVLKKTHKYKAMEKGSPYQVNWVDCDSLSCYI